MQIIKEKREKENRRTRRQSHEASAACRRMLNVDYKCSGMLGAEINYFVTTLVD